MAQALCSSPLQWIDGYIGGLRRGETILITGGPKTFKSCLAAMFVLHAAGLGEHLTVYTGDRRELAYLDLLAHLADEGVAVERLPIRLIPGTPDDEQNAVDDAAEHGSSVLVIDNAHQLAPTLVRRGSRSDDLAIVLVERASATLESAAEMRQVLHAANHVVATVMDGPLLNVMLAASQFARVGYDTFDAKIWDADAGWVLSPVRNVVSRAISLPSLERAEMQPTLPHIARLLRGGDSR